MTHRLGVLLLTLRISSHILQHGELFHSSQLNSSVPGLSVVLLMFCNRLNKQTKKQSKTARRGQFAQNYFYSISTPQCLDSGSGDILYLVYFFGSNISFLSSNKSANPFSCFPEKHRIPFWPETDSITFWLAQKKKKESTVSWRRDKINTAVTEQSCRHHRFSPRSQSFKWRRPQIPPAANSLSSCTGMALHFCKCIATSVQILRLQRLEELQQSVKVQSFACMEPGSKKQRLSEGTPIPAMQTGSFYCVMSSTS